MDEKVAASSPLERLREQERAYCAQGSRLSELHLWETAKEAIEFITELEAALSLLREEQEKLKESASRKLSQANAALLVLSADYVEAKAIWEAEVVTLRAALLAQRNEGVGYGVDDPLCWCGVNSGFKLPHTPECEQAKAVMAAGTPTEGR